MDTDPTAGLLLLHVPPEDVVFSEVVKPTHTFIVPVIEAGNGLTVAITTAKQPVGNVYDMVGLPAAPPLTIPDTIPTVACTVLLLLQLPPPVVSDKVVVEPTHTTGVPLIAAGTGLTVTVAVVKQPVGNV